MLIIIIELKSVYVSSNCLYYDVSIFARVKFLLLETVHDAQRQILAFIKDALLQLLKISLWLFKIAE